MNVTYEKKDALNGTVSVNITTEDYLPSYDKKLKDYGKKANIPGFRAGHAPKGMIEKMVGNSLLLEEINTLASKGLFDYIEGNKLNVLGQPVLNEDTKIDELTKEANYTFNFDIGLSPEIELNIGNEDVFTKYAETITDEMINEEIERMKKSFGKLTDVEEVAENDMIYVGLTELNEKGEILEGENAWFNEETNLKINIRKRIQFWSFPDILIIDFKRFNSRFQKNQILVTFPLDNLDLSKYVIGYKKECYKYELYAVCNHSGSVMGGHYTSVVKNANGNWYHFNDQDVSLVVTLDNVITPKAYCLFYRKKHN
jgi:hypothetical protein